MSTVPETDRRTTPRWLRVPVVVVLSAQLVYFLACFHFAMAKEIPEWAYFGHWDMFTQPGRSHHVVEGEAYVSGVWQAFDPSALFTYQWGSGPRYARSAFRNSPGRMAVLAASTCGRHPDKPEKVRYYDVSWSKTIGSFEQPRRNEKKKPLIEWDCTKQHVKLPLGRSM